MEMRGIKKEGHMSKKKVSHPIHRALGKALRNTKLTTNYELVLDPACEKNGKHIPLFREKKANATECCNVDAIILKKTGPKLSDREIRVIIEIEESNVKPTQVCGKLLTAELAQYYVHSRHGNALIGKGKKVLFVQVVKKPRPPKSAKPAQAKLLEKGINDLLKRLKPSRGIRRYHLFCVSSARDKKTISKMVGEIQRYL
jgi:hypothetical protein